MGRSSFDRARNVRAEMGMFVGISFLLTCITFTEQYELKINIMSMFKSLIFKTGGLFVLLIRAA